MLRHMKSVREIDWTGRHRSANYSPVDIENYHRVSTWLCCSLCELHMSALIHSTVHHVTVHHKPFICV